MRIVHRIAFNADAVRMRRLRDLGVNIAQPVGIPGSSSSMGSFEISEDNPAWDEVRSLTSAWRATDVVRTVFTAGEISRADWLVVRPTWHCGYPQPAPAEFGYRNTTYRGHGACALCGVGLKQVAPFELEGEPSWGVKGILQLNWVFDEFFVRPEVFERHFLPFGVGSREVVGPKGVPLSSVVQLDIRESVGVDTTGLQWTECEQCHTKRYLPVVRGSFPCMCSAPAAHAVKTAEYFGSGAGAHHAVLFSGQLVRSLNDGRVRGVSYLPVDTAGCSGQATRPS